MNDKELDEFECQVLSSRGAVILRQVIARKVLAEVERLTKERDNLKYSVARLIGGSGTTSRLTRERNEAVGLLRDLCLYLRSGEPRYASEVLTWLADRIPGTITAVEAEDV